MRFAIDTTIQAVVTVADAGSSWTSVFEPGDVVSWTTRALEIEIGLPREVVGINFIYNSHKYTAAAHHITLYLHVRLCSIRRYGHVNVHKNSCIDYYCC